MAHRKRNKTIIICFAALFVVVTTFSLFCLFNNQDVKFISDNIQQDESDYTNNDIVNNNDNNEQISLIEDETIPNIPQNKDESDYTQLYFYVVFYDQYGNELQRETLKYGTVPTFKGDYPSGFITWDKTLTAIVGNTYIHARCSTTNRKSKRRIPEKATITVLPQNIIGEDDSSYGTVTGAGTYFPGTTITLQATPKENCIFLGWDDGVKESTRDVVVDVNITYKAIFDTNYLWFKNVGDTSDTLYVGTMVQCGAGTYDSLSWSVDDDGKITLEPQDVIYIKSNGYYTTFSDVTSGTKSSIACGGSIMSLIDEIGTTLEIPSNKSFGFLFSNFTNLTSPPRLTATTLAKNCYNGMFSGCTNLTLPNDFTLPATNLAQYCYFRMFSDCTNLTMPNGFTLPATTLTDSCYQYMFYKCSNLTLPNDFTLPATTLSYCCYAYMFSGCTNLTLPNDFTLPATTLSYCCYDNMFSDCTNLTLPNDFTLSATTLASTCYQDMFSNCSSLTIPNGFTLPATTLANSCYRGMFSGCTSLTLPNDFTLPATTLANYCYYDMFSGCTSLTLPNDFTLPAENLIDGCYAYMFSDCTNLTLPNDFTLSATTLSYCCYDNMFSGCTSLTLPNDFTLPATTLANYCYYDMFSGCTSLTLPNGFTLPATTLANYCYQGMFSGCTNLTIPNDFTLPATTLAQYCYQNMFSNCTNLTKSPIIKATSTDARDSLLKMFNGCTNLSEITIYSNDWNDSYSSNWVKDVASSGTLYCPTGCNITEGENGIPTGWTRANIPIMLTSINKDIDTPLMKTLLEDGPLEFNDIENLDDVFIDFNSLPEF